MIRLLELLKTWILYTSLSCDLYHSDWDYIRKLQVKSIKILDSFWIYREYHKIKRFLKK